MIGNKIKQLRKERGLTQTELADALNRMFGSKFERSMISKWENGQQEPQMYSISCLAKFFDISIDRLMEWQDAEIKTEEDEKNAEVIIFEGGSKFDLAKLPDGTREDLTKVVQILHYEYSDNDFGLQIILDKKEILNLDALSLEKKKDLMKYIRFLLSDEK